MIYWILLHRTKRRGGWTQIWDANKNGIWSFWRLIWTTSTSYDHGKWVREQYKTFQETRKNLTLRFVYISLYRWFLFLLREGCLYSNVYFLKGDESSCTTKITPDKCHLKGRHSILDYQVNNLKILKYINLKILNRSFCWALIIMKLRFFRRTWLILPKCFISEM